MPNKCAMVQYSVGVAIHYSVTATLRSKESALCKTVSVLLRAGDNLLQMYPCIYKSFQANLDV